MSPSPGVSSSSVQIHASSHRSGIEDTRPSSRIMSHFHRTYDDIYELPPQADPDVRTYPKRLQELLGDRPINQC